MRDFIISTETTSDLAWDFAQKHKIELFPMYYFMDNKDYEGTRESSLSGTAFYERIRKGSLPTTSMVTQTQAENYFERILDKDVDILHIAFSSGLSVSCENFKSAARFLNSKYKEERVIVVDSLSGSSGEGLLAYLAVRINEKGASLREAADYVSNKAPKICHYFTVDDLRHMQRGGKISRAKANMGSLFKLKPILHLDSNGDLIHLYNARGRENSLLTLVDKLEKKQSKSENELIFINHGDCLADAMFVRNEIKKRFGYRDFEINFVGPVIGAHAGPGSVAVFFIGENRMDK